MTTFVKAVTSESKYHKMIPLFRRMVTLAGFEPATSTLKG